MAFSMAMPWHEGETKMHRLLHVPEQDNPTASTLTPQLSWMLQRGPLLALGTLDNQSRPWTTLLGGQGGFSKPLGGSIIGTRTVVDTQNDPVVQALVGDVKKGEMLQPQDRGKLLSGLAVDLMTRKRVKLAGRMIAATVRDVYTELDGISGLKQDEIQLVMHIDQSLGNCPKYLNQYEVRPALIESRLISSLACLSDEGRGLISNCDMFFLTTSTAKDMDTNIRGGPVGFVRIMSPTQIVYPEYSGNRLFQSLGNLQMKPQIGITFPDLQSGHVLYITGSAEILVGKDAATTLPGSNLAVKITIELARLVERGLPLRGLRRIPSPYNPPVRTLAAEGNIKSYLSDRRQDQQTAHLIDKILITSSIARFTFAVPGGISYEAGQWVAMDFKGELDLGYAHMRDDDPSSLNDDFVRTFTISSTPASDDGKEKTFDIIIRRVGPVTGHLFQQNNRTGYEVPILGVGGGFKIEQNAHKVTPFIAGGVGITPLLGQLPFLQTSLQQIRLFWTLKIEDIAFADDLLQRCQMLIQSTEIYLTGIALGPETEEKIKGLEQMGVHVKRRRLRASDFNGVDAQRWYLCAGKLLRTEVLSWLHGKSIISEDFDY